MTTRVSSWGRLESPEHQVVALDQLEQLPVKSSSSGLPFGNGRSYGDVCLNPNGVLWTTRGLDRFMAFDAELGLLTCEAGVLLRDIQRMAIPRGWMLPVTPGTQLVTVGGAIANDIHGKNHHILGSFGDHVQRIHLLRTDGQTIVCGPDQTPEWFKATVGGMGLTGVIAQATLQLRRIEGPWLEAENVPFNQLSEFFQLADESEAGWEHTVSWIDCLNSQGRGVFMRGNHVVAAQTGSIPSGGGIAVPLVPPISLINKLSLRPFNLAYYQLQARKREKAMVHYEPFFHPLDNVHHWNRIYGPKGFYQYQSVVPRNVGKEAVAAMLRTIAAAGEGSFLAVLKTFGERQSVGMMSFPMPGVTLALDFPNKGEKTLALLRSLDAIVREAGGRIYAAKDARMPRDLFESGYPQWTEFVKYRDPGISSAMSRRLMGY
jgi:FAD/FMN-containing dehydrogenase